MKRVFTAALLASAALAHAQAPATPTSPAKKELVQKLMALQQAGIENLARGMVERPALQMAQEARAALQRLPDDKREAAAKAIDADIKKYVEEAVPIVRDRALKLAPSTIGAAMEEKFTEDELRQLIAWLDSPVNKKFGQLGPEMQNNFQQKLFTEVGPTMDPKMQALVAKVRNNLGLPPPSASAPGGTGPAKAATPAKKAASK
jgi:hypothetical protein